MNLRMAGTQDYAADLLGETPATTSPQANMPTSALEKALLLLILVTLPLESHMVLIPGFSTQFILLGAAGIYLFLNRPGALLATVGQPLFLATYLFLVYGSAMEMTAQNASHAEIVRIAQMIVGAILIASMCRDLSALRVALYGYLLSGLWLSLLLFLTSYGAIQGASVSTFEEASELRMQTFADNPIEANINGMAFLSGQGAVVALAFALHAETLVVRNMFIGIGLFCMVASFLPLSRGGVAITVVACASVMYACGLRQGKVILTAVVLGAVLLMLVPESVWSRMSFSFEEREGKVEGRALVYGAAIGRLPDYLFTGVGSGNFWSAWGRRTEFGSRGRVSGSHNTFLQVTLYWGLGGLMALMLVIFQAYRCIPRFCHRHPGALSLIGLGITLLLFSQIVHNLYAKEFSLGLGLLAGSRCWIWPNGIVTREV